MNSRECVTRTIEFKRPDRIPISYMLNPVTFSKYTRELKELFTRFPPDFIDINKQIELSIADNPKYKRGEFIDEWGCTWKNRQDGFMGRCIGHPLSNWKVLNMYKFPDPLDDPLFDKCEKEIMAVGHEKYICGGWELLFERMARLCGYEKLMIDLIMRPSEVRLLADKILHYNLIRIKRWCELNIDGVIIADDWGTQNNLMIKPELWRRLFKPYYQKMFDTIHQEGKHVFFHSDGYIIDIIPDLIECGVDVLFIQMWVPSIKEVGRRFGGKVCFLADPDRQHILPFGTIKEVKHHVKQIVEIFGGFNGGLIGNASIDTPEVPIENIKAIYEAYKKYGEYSQCSV